MLRSEVLHYSSLYQKQTSNKGGALVLKYTIRFHQLTLGHRMLFSSLVRVDVFVIFYRP